MSVRVSPLSKGADSPSGERGDLGKAGAPQARGGISACLLALLSGMVAGCGAPAPTAFFPVVRTTMPGGYSLFAIQQPAAKDACEQANARYLAPIKSGCPDCKIDYSGCEASLSGVEKALSAGEAVPQYSLMSAKLRLLINGPDAVAKAVCEQMAGDLGKKGTTAACVAPGVKR